MVFRAKLLALTMTGILLVGVIPLAVTSLRRGQLRSDMLEELNTLGRSECAKVATDVYLMLRAQHEKLKKEVRHDLNVARYVMAEAGGFTLVPDRVHWKATNQSSGHSVELDLEKVFVGRHWLGQNADAASPSPVVDQVRSLVGARCTIFQRMNDSGDLLRVCTNVLKKDGTRAIGTYIPAVEPDGTTNPVVAAVLRGETYVGRAHVVDDWYLTAYEPIFDAKRRIVGALFCGVRLEDIPELRKGIVDITVGRTGYAYVLGGTGEQKGRYVISQRGRRDGENIYDSQDALGGFFIRSIIEKALQTKNGECRFTKYAWRNPGEKTPRTKVAATTYFEPWDWVIGVGTYEDDFQTAIVRVDQTASRLIFWGTVGAFIAFMLCGMLAWVESGRIAAMDREIAERKLAQARQGRMLRRLEKLNQLQKDMLQPGPLADKLKKVTDFATEAFDLDFCRIWQVEPGDLCSAGCIHATAVEDRHVCPRRDVCLHLVASSGRYAHLDGDHRRVPFGCYKIGRIVSGEENKFLTNDVTVDPEVHDHEWAKSLGLVSFAGYRLRDMHGNPIGVLAMFAKHELSEEDDAFLSALAETTSGVVVESKAEEALRESERRLATIIDFLPDATFAIDRDGKIIAWNRAIEELTGAPASEMLGKGDYAYAVPLYGEAQPILIDLVFGGGEEQRKLYDFVEQRGIHWIAERFVPRLLGGKGAYIWGVAAPLYDSAGRMVGAIESIRDITQQRWTQEELQRSERRFMDVLYASSDAMLIVDSGKFVDCNDAAARMLGYAKKEDFLMSSPEQLSPPVQPDGRNSEEKADEMEEIATRQGSHRFEWIHRKANGEDFPVEVAISAIVVRGRNQLLCVWRDIAERKRAQKALEDSERRLATIIEVLPDATFAIDAEGRVIAWNRAIEEITGIPASEMLGKGDYAYAVPLYGRTQPMMIDIVLGGHEERWADYDFVEQKGTHLIAQRFVPNLYGGKGAYLWGVVAPLQDSDGRIVGAIETFRDITEQKLAEEALRTSETKYRTVYDASTDGILLRTLDRRIVAANRAAVAMFGCSDESELIAASLAQLSPEYQPDGSLSAEKADRILEIICREKSFSFEWCYNRKDGTPFYATVELTTMNLGSEKFLLTTIRDVTEQKRAEESLRASETRYKTLYDSSVDGIMIRTLDRRIVAANRAAVAMFGCNDENELIAMTPEELSPDRQPDGLLSTEKARQMREAAMHDGAAFFEWTYRRKDGSHFHAMVALTTMSLEGQCFHLNTIRDITEQKEAERALRASETKYKTLYDASSDAILLRAPDRRIISGNRAAVALFGCKDESELLAMTPADLYPEYQPDGQLSAERAPQLMETTLRDGRNSFEWQYRRKDGTEFLANVLSTKMELEGEPVVLSTVHDITILKQAEEERTLSAQRMESLLALSRMTDRPADEIIAMIVEDAIRMTRSTLGYLASVSEDESVMTIQYWSKSVYADCGVRDQTLVYPIETMGLWGEAVRQRRPVVTNDYAAPSPLKRGMPEGHVPIVRHMNIPVFDGRRIVSVAGVANKPTDYDERDLRQLQLLMDGGWRIIAQKQYELNLAQARDEAEAANRAKSQFLATMSHEIRTPMTAILGYADLLMDPEIDASTRNNYVATIRRSGEHLLSLINDILDLSKIEAGKMTLEFGHCHLAVLLADVASMLRPRAEKHGISLSLEYLGPIPETIRTDGAGLRQAIVNLVGNAIKFTEKGGVRIVASFSPDACDGQPAVRIDVIDTGIGIGPETLSQLFRPFSQGDASLTRKYGGTGLGLVISRHLARLLGGDLTVCSELGRGSTFTLVIPTGSLDGVSMLQDPAEVTLDESGKGWSPEVGHLAGMRILLAEDGIDNRELIQAVLQRVGAEVETAENGRVAVERATARPFDLILMDMNMPEMDGYQATGVLRDQGYHGPIVALTANAMIGDSERCRAAGCDAYLTKPIDRKLLVRTIAALVGAGAVSRDAAEAERSPIPFLNAANVAMPAQELSPDSANVLISEFINDPEMAPIIQRFVERLGDQLDAMYRSLANHEHEELRRLAHKLKGAGGSYGYPRLTDASKMLEEAAQSRDDAAETTAIERVAATILAVQSAFPPAPVA